MIEFWFSDKTINIFNNFVVYEIVVCDGKVLSWFSNKIKSLINEKLRTYTVYCKNISNSQLFGKVNSTALLELTSNFFRVSFLFVFSKIPAKFAKSCWSFLADFQCGFRPSLSTADLVTVPSDIIARGLKWYGAARAVARDISKAFNMVGHVDLPYKLKSFRSGI